MNKIIIHWTAGLLVPNSVDLKHYHFLIDKYGRINNGIFKPEDNENCYDGKYATHTGGGNTGAIGVAICGMCGFSSINKIGAYPINKIQCEAMFNLVAKLAYKYGIPINADHIMTHYEFGKKNPKTTSFGKIDIIYLPPYPEVKANKIGDFIRNKIKWYFQKLVRKSGKNN